MAKSKGINYTSTREINNKNRTLLTQIIVYCGYALMTFLSILIIVIAQSTDKFESAKWVFNAIIPLIASWVGTVIAFYFGRDNFEAATEQALALRRDTLDDISVENIMINIKTIVSRKIDPMEDEHIKIAEIIKVYKEVEKDRIPIFSTALTPRFIIHRSSMIDYKEQKNMEGKKDLTLKNMIEDTPEKFSYMKERGFVTVPTTSSVEEALKKMESVKDCQDVFITDNGEETGKVLGWLTNTLINRFLTV